MLQVCSVRSGNTESAAKAWPSPALSWAVSVAACSRAFDRPGSRDGDEGAGADDVQDMLDRGLDSGEDKADLGVGGEPADGHQRCHTRGPAEADPAEVEQQRAHGRLEDFGGGGAQRVLRGHIQFAGDSETGLMIAAVELEGQTGLLRGGGWRPVKDPGALLHDEPRSAWPMVGTSVDRTPRMRRRCRRGRRPGSRGNAGLDSVDRLDGTPVGTRPTRTASSTWAGALATTLSQPFAGEAGEVGAAVGRFGGPAYPAAVLQPAHEGRLMDHRGRRLRPRIGTRGSLVAKVCCRDGGIRS
jgi:hypothetical protein